MRDFEVVVDSIGDRPEQHVFEVDRSWWADRIDYDLDAGDEFVSVFRFVCELARVREDLLLSGDFEGGIGLECSRCGKRYAHALHDSFRLLLSPANADLKRGVGERGLGGSGEQILGATGPVGLDPEGERGLAENGLCLGEDLDTGWFRGPVIRLNDLFGEVIATSMPLKPLCREDCPGVCPHCGVDFSEASCDCEDQKVDSPFAVLAQLKDRAD